MVIYKYINEAIMYFIFRFRKLVQMFKLIKSKFHFFVGVGQEMDLLEKKVI